MAPGCESRLLQSVIKKASGGYKEGFRWPWLLGVSHDITVSYKRRLQVAMAPRCESRLLQSVIKGFRRPWLLGVSHGYYSQLLKRASGGHGSWV